MLSPTFRGYDRRPFDRETCTMCGECLRHCPVMALPLDRAKMEWERTVAGERTPALRRCTSCMACNLYCPENCRPANLFLDRWHEAYLRHGLPMRAAHFLPHTRPNFRTRILDEMPRDEQQIVSRWRRDEPAEAFLYPGCNLITSPYLTFSRQFDGVEIRGGLDYCCGEMLFRMGLYESVEQVARRLTHWFHHLGARRVYLVCTAGLNMMRSVLPQFGARFEGIEFLSFYHVVLNKLLSGDLGVLRPLETAVTVQDSCHTRAVEPGFADVPRRILEILGVDVIEPPHSHEQQLCCGIGAGFSHASAYHPLELLLSARRTSRDHRQPGDRRGASEATCVYCSGCLEMLSVARYADPSRRPVIHLLELVQLALGESPRRRQGQLAWQFIRGTVARQFPHLLSRERLRVPDLPVEPSPEVAL